MHFGFLLLSTPLATVPISYTTSFPTEFTYEHEASGEISSNALPLETPRWGLLTNTTTHQSWSVRVDQYAIVRLTSKPDDSTWRQLGLDPVDALMPSIGLWRVRDAHGLRDGVQLSQDLRPAIKSGQLEYIMPDFGIQRHIQNISIPPNDVLYSGQWYLDQISIEKAWQSSTGTPETVVVVVDNGCDESHPDLVDNLAPGLDLIDGDPEVNYAPNVQGNEHGTACAGIIAARGDNSIGISGVCPECTVRCVRLLGEVTPISAHVEALRFALEVNAAVISNSWSYTNGVPAPVAVAEAIAEIQEEGRNGLGTMVVFAAGNDNSEIIEGEVAALPGVVTVGATNNFDEATAFTNYGAFLDITAPAGTLTTDVSGADGADPTDYTSTFGGTSSACPVIAGVAGLLASARPEATVAELRQALLQTTRPAPYAQPDETGHDPYYGYGIVDPEASLQFLTSTGEQEPVDEEKNENPPPNALLSGDSDGCQNTSEKSLSHLLLISIGLMTLRLWRRQAALTTRKTT